MHCNWIPDLIQLCLHRPLVLNNEIWFLNKHIKLESFWTSFCIIKSAFFVDSVKPCHIFTQNLKGLKNNTGWFFNYLIEDQKLRLSNESQNVELQITGSCPQFNNIYCLIDLINSVAVLKLFNLYIA